MGNGIKIKSRQVVGNIQETQWDVPIRDRVCQGKDVKKCADDRWMETANKLADQVILESNLNAINNEKLYAACGWSADKPAPNFSTADGRVEAFDELRKCQAQMLQYPVAEPKAVEFDAKPDQIKPPKYISGNLEGSKKQLKEWILVQANEEYSGDVQMIFKKFKIVVDDLDTLMDWIQTEEEYHEVCNEIAGTNKVYKTNAAQMGAAVVDGEFAPYLVYDFTLSGRWGRWVLGLDTGLMIDRKVPHFDMGHGELAADPADPTFRAFLPYRMELFTQYLYGDLNVDDISYIKLLFGLWDGDPRTYGNPMKASPSKYYGLNDTGFLSVGVTGEHFFDNVAKLYYKAIFSPEADVNPDWASPAKVLFTNNKSIDVLVGGEVTVAPGQALWLQGHISPLFPEKGDAIVRMGAAGGANVTFVKDRLAAGVQGHVYDVGQNIIWGTTGILKLNLSDKTRKLLNMISFWGGLRDAPSGAGWTDAEGSSFDMGQKAKQGEAGISLLLFKEQLALSYAQIWSLMGREDSNYDNVSLFAIDWYWGKTFGIQ